ncbi:carboxypeptidase-like regulatory domain-containing protein [Thermodesulfobium sp. 4217-1]|uniref:carboxypeptidase-like regulatory domain-containing protein n=1 Tax=Thermodesulfobium sp. 4217-1 TaxID=3120013 RepID=UPI0032214889
MKSYTSIIIMFLFVTTLFISNARAFELPFFKKSNKAKIEKITPAQLSETGFFGFVISKESFDPIPNATIKFNNEQTTSSDRGYFSVQGLKPGKYKLFVSAAGFKPLKRTIEVKAGTYNQIDSFELNPIPKKTNKKKKKFLFFTF